MNVVAIFSTRFSETFVSPHPFPFPRARQGVVKIFFFPRRKKEPSSGPSTSRLWNGSGPLYERTIITIPPAHLHGTPASSRMSLPNRLISSNSPDLHTRPTKTNTILSHPPSGFPEICSQHFLHPAKSRIDLFYILFHLRNDINRRCVDWNANCENLNSDFFVTTRANDIPIISDISILLVAIIFPSLICKHHCTIWNLFSGSIIKSPLSNKFFHSSKNLSKFRLRNWTTLGPFPTPDHSDTWANYVKSFPLPGGRGHESHGNNTAATMPRPVRPSLCTLCRLCALPSLASLYFNDPLVVPFPRFRVHLFSTFFAIKEGLSLPSPRHQDFLRLLCARVATSHADYDTEHMSFLIVLILGLASLSLFKSGSSCFLVYFIWRKIRFDSIFGREKYTIGCFC